MTMPVETTHRYSVEQYLRLDDESEEKHEFRDGEIIAMSGGTINHSLITLNIGGELRSRLKGSECRAYDSNLRVRIQRRTLYAYPDVTVVCGPTQIDPDDPSGQTLINPRLVVEVLSPSTELYNRTKKFERYRKLQSFREYVLVSQDRALVEWFFRYPDGSWRFDVRTDLTESIQLKSLEIELPLAEIYAGVEFPPPPPEPGTTDPLPQSPPQR